VSICTIFYYFATGQELLVDYDVNIYYFTLPLLIAILTYTFLAMLIASIHVVGYRKILKWQYGEFVHSDKSSLNKKLCSIIIAARNEENVIRDTIMECLRQTHQNIEILVVCHNCSDETFDESSVNDPRVRSFDYRTEAAGKGIALNFGVEKARGEYILILDADGILSPNFIEYAIPLLSKYAAVQGRYVPSNRDYSFLTRLLSMEGDLWSTPYMTARTILDKRGGLGGTGYIVRKDSLKEVGGFSNHLVDDYELTTRLLMKKERVVFVPHCINYDEKPPNLEIMFRQRARWARGFLNMLQRKVVEPTDIIGILYWISPIIIFLSLVMTFIVGFGCIYNLIFGYFPYYYASITIEQWIIINLGLYLVQSLTILQQYGKKGLRYLWLLPIYNVFVLYVFVIFIKAFGVKSWGNTKTQHGFVHKK
jgi:cellulose synthase/poly-beta-1,6-N-acetylglucosamine synthase-like glycosyltransferase